ncbi:MAG: hypothetical protein KBD50_00150 [Candidatus Pacebacteria bacterium]|nr:hypothetical protein [Candidatus Paceibacterota bacterium]
MTDRYTRFTAQELFVQDLWLCGSPDVILHEETARNLLSVCHHKLRSLNEVDPKDRENYRTARNQTLEEAVAACEIDADEWDNYKKFIDIRFLQRAWEANSRKHRPRTPLYALEDGH